MTATDAQQRKAVADIDVETAVDRAVEAYEHARLAGEPVDLVQFAPPADHRQYAEVACELMRVDLEYAWNAGEHKGVEDYRPAFAAALELPTVVERVAFEEYRLRSHAGEPVSPADFRERYGIDTGRWPILSGTSFAAAITRSDTPDDRNDANSGGSLGSSVEFPTTPGRFLDFELVLELGRGAFARVYLARQSELAQRFVVLKVSRSFSDEPQRLAQLQHTNIVPIYSVHHAGALRAVCMPFFGGATLADLLAPFGHGNKMPASGREFVSTLIAVRQSTLVADGPQRSGVQSSASPPTEALCEMSAARSTSADPLLAGLERSSYVEAVLLLAEQLTDGLAHAHQRGVVHRDIKPANVLVTDEGRAMLLDFNLAVSTEATAAADRSLGGTLVYMPPEMLDALASDIPPAAADPRGDVYAVGVLLFEMLTGRLPIPAANGPIREVAARMAGDRRAGLPSVRALNPAVPYAVEAIVRKCLAFDRDARYASAEELHDDLLCQRRNLPLLHVREPSLRERCVKWSRRHPTIASATTVALAASVLLFASLGAWWYRGEELARRDAVAAAAELHRDVLAWRIPLGTHDLDAQSLDETLRTVDELLADHEVLESGGWRSSPGYQRLSPSDQTQVDRDAGELCYLAAGATYRKALVSDETERRAAIERARQINDTALTTLTAFGDDDSTLRSSLARQRDVLAAALTNKAPSHANANANESVTPKSTSDVYLAALGHIERGDFAAAISLVQPRVASDPRDYALRYALAQAHRGRGDRAAAIDEFTACTALAPESHLAFFYRGLCRLEEEDFRGARRDFDEVLRLAPGLPAGLLNRAVARERLEDISGAIEDLSASLANGITETRVYFLRARLFEKLGDTDGAQRDRQEGFRRPPRDEASFLARGVAHLPSDAKAALAEFQAALVRYPESIAARRNIAHVLSEHLGRPAEAIAELDVVAKRCPRDAAAIVGRGVLLARLGRRDEAHRDGETALQASRDGQTVYQAACIYALTTSTAVEDAPKALKLLAEALLVQPRSARIAATDADMRAIAKDTEFRRLLAAAAMLDRARSAEVKPQ